MTKISLTIRYCGSEKAPADWPQAISLQRLYYIKSGRGAYRMPGGQMVPFEPGKLYIFPLNLEDCFVTEAEDPIDHLYFDFLSTPPIIAPEPQIYEVKEGSFLQELLCMLDRMCIDLRLRYGRKVLYARSRIDSEEVMLSRQMMESLFHALLLQLAMIRPIPFSDDAAIRDTLEQIRLHYAEPLNVGGLAEASGFDVSYFIRRFKSAMGMTPYAYLRSYRLMRAEELMADGMTAAEAAEAVGYENASSLRRALRGLRCDKIRRDGV